MNRLQWTISGLALCLLVAGCSGRSYKGDQRFTLDGAASYDGELIDLGSISFVPATGEKERAAGGVITDGKYHIPEENGPTQGKYRVEIRWLKKTGKQLLDAETGEMYDQRFEALPAKFNESTELTVEVPSADGKYDFLLKST